MKGLVSIVMFFVLVFSFSRITRADEIDDLRKEIQQLRQEHETKIDKLQAQIDELDKKQEEVDEKFLNVEYVGRYEGPFKKGGLHLHYRNQTGF